jgi:hypothetical protein
MMTALSFDHYHNQLDDTTCTSELATLVDEVKWEMGNGNLSPNPTWLFTRLTLLYNSDFKITRTLTTTDN